MFLPPLDFSITFSLLLHSPNNTNLWCYYGLSWNLSEHNTKLSHSSVPGFWPWPKRVFCWGSHRAETEVTAGTVNLSDSFPGLPRTLLVGRFQSLTVFLLTFCQQSLSNQKLLAIPCYMLSPYQFTKPKSREWDLAHNLLKHNMDLPPRSQTCPQLVQVSVIHSTLTLGNMWQMGSLRLESFSLELFQTSAPSKK